MRSGATPRATKARPSAPPYISTQVLRLPRKVKVDVTKCHACRANGTSISMSPNATPARQSGAAPRATKARPSAPPEPAQCLKYHVCQAKLRWMSPSATPATQMERQCHQVPRLPVTKLCDKVVCERWCVTSCGWKMVCDKVVGDKVVCHSVSKRMCDKFVFERRCVKDGGWQSCVTVCQRGCLTKLCVKDGV